MGPVSRPRAQIQGGATSATPRSRWPCDRFLGVGSVLLLVAVGGCGTGERPDPPLVYLGESVINPVPQDAGDPPIGGLSSLFHVGDGIYYAVSDDRGRRGPARYYTISVDLTDGSLDQPDVTVNTWHGLLDQNGEPLEPETYDLEGFVAHGQNFFASSEGDASEGIPPFVAVFGADAVMIERLGLPPGFAPSTDGTTGVRSNMAFEGLAITADGKYLFTATESALRQDGPAATPTRGARVRILRFAREHGVFDAQYAYDVDPVHTAPPGNGLAGNNGIVELLALSAEHLLVLERSFVAGADPEHSIKLFEACLGAATDVSQIASLADADSVVPARKRLIADLADLVPHTDNVEGMTFGPDLPSGEPTLVVVTDNNFAPERQVTQIIAFAIRPHALQGCSTGG